MHVFLLYMSAIVFIEGVLLDSCYQHTVCDDCIRDASVCKWCAANDYKGEHRCHSNDANLTMCEGYVENPKNETTAVTARNFSITPGNVCQIKPQKYAIKLTPGQPAHFSFSFAAVKDYPVDVYFLLDASNTMKTTKEDAVAQSKSIYDTLYSYTKDVYLGMGTFIDKNALPFNKNITENVVYSFKHELKLNSNYSKFQEVMNNTKFGTNHDYPEGGLDALAQAIVCKKEIGWRTESRKIIIFLTDGPYHAAGDGKSAGIFQPYDGKCYTVNGTYRNELIMDYPSVSMINKLAKDHDVIIIFAIDRKAENFYKKLTDSISGAHMNILAPNVDDNLVKILKDIYEKITKSIILKVNKISGQRNEFKLTFNPDCKKKKPCDVNSGKIYDFNGTITLPEYKGLDHGIVDIGIEGISEKLTLDIEIVNECGCKKVAISSDDCNGEVQECGVCKCKEPKYGLNCACERNKDSAIIDDSTACKMNGTNIDCNGRGTCTCGKCTDCKTGFGGKYCECNLMLCPRDSNGELCGGWLQGECLCDKKCKCKSGWSGQVCECSDSVELCKGYNGKVCNNRGSCVCEQCHCHDPASWDARTKNDPFCHLTPSPESHERQCKLLTDCVNCVVMEHNDCSSQCSFTNYTVVDTLDADNFFNIPDAKFWKNCTNERVDFGCYANFTYKYDINQYRVLLKIQKHYTCAESYLIYGGILLVTLIALGVGTLVTWKLLNDYRDRREYLNFMKNELQEDKSENPLYEPATTVIRNPVFKRSFTGYT